MHLRQELFVFTASDYDELAWKINAHISEVESSLEIQQINYANLEEEACGSPTAFVLMRPKKEA